VDPSPQSRNRSRSATRKNAQSRKGQNVNGRQKPKSSGRAQGRSGSSQKADLAGRKKQGGDGQRRKDVSVRTHDLQPLHSRAVVPAYPERAVPATDVRRNVVLAVGLGALVAVAAIGWVAGTLIKSPAEIAAQTAPPNASTITVPVEQRALTSDVVTRGTVKFGSPQSVALPGSALKKSSGIVTTPPVLGASLKEGSVALTVSGRPVFILQGAQPAHRDLGPGSRGQDVQQLEDALSRLGFSPGTREGVYDSRTATAVTAWYKATGYSAFGPTDEQVIALRSAETDAFGAETELLNAEEAVINARNAHAAAVERARAARSAARKAPPESQEDANAEARFAEEDVGRVAELVNLARRRLDLMTRRSAATKAIVSEINGKLGIQVPADEILFFPTVPLRVGEVTVKVGEQISGSVMTATNSVLLIEGSLTPNDAKLVRKGASVSIEEADLGVKANGEVTVIADTPGTNGVDAQRFYFAVTPGEAPPSIVGATVVLTVRVQSTGEEALVVPISALSVTADGNIWVQVREKNGTVRRVKVKPGLAAKGLVAVEPVEGKLSRGDLVVVGKSTSQRPASPAASPGPTNAKSPAPKESGGSR
jgi:peptidoglycan hydrolase-like protein with peptidoglycan-binding domain